MLLLKPDEVELLDLSEHQGEDEEEDVDEEGEVEPELDANPVADEDVEEEEGEVGGHRDQGQVGVPEGLWMKTVIKYFFIIILNLNDFNSIIFSFSIFNVVVQSHFFFILINFNSLTCMVLKSGRVPLSGA